MSLVLVTPPVDFPVSIHELKMHLNLENVDHDDALLARYLASAVAELDGPEGWFGRALLTQTWDFKLDEFPGGAIEIPLPPLQSITSIKYFDSEGIEQTLASSVYQVVGVGSSSPGKVQPAINASWPSAQSIPEAVTVRFVAGYGAASDVPAPIRRLLMLSVGDAYAHRETMPPGITIEHIPTDLNRYRVWPI